MSKLTYTTNSGFIDVGKEELSWNEVFLTFYEVRNPKRFNDFVNSLYDRFMIGPNKNNKPFLIRISNYDACAKNFNSILFNSSVWFRITDLEDNESYKDAIFFFEKNKKIYETTNAIENLEFNLRLQQVNFLSPKKEGHGHHITPKLYHNELQCANDILTINTETNVEDYKYQELINHYEVTLRILLIDDKIGKNDEEPKVDIIANIMEGKILTNFAKNKIPEIKSNKIEELCKQIKIDFDITNHELLKKLNEVLNNESTDFKIKDLAKECVDQLDPYKYVQRRFLWKEEEIKKIIFISDNSKLEKLIKEQGITYTNKVSDIKSKTKNVQIVQVANLEDAIFLLSQDEYKFDLIFMDYLLDEIKNSSGRELITAFFEWLKDKDGVNSNIAYLKSEKAKEVRKKLINEKYEFIECELDCSIDANCEFHTQCFEKNEEIRKKVSQNRGPLRKFWFFPITAFNDTLISDLVGKGIRLIDYYWHIEHGADPVTTPYLFLRQLNNFLYLQLEEAVYSERELIRFIEKNISFIDELKGNNNDLDFKKFSALMGAEYSKFVNDFLNRPLIYNDKDTSLFSGYIWDNFMNNGDKKNLFLAVQAYQKFLHRCAYGSRSEYKEMKYFWAETLIVLDQLKDATVSNIGKMNNLLNDIKFD